MAELSRRTFLGSTIAIPLSGGTAPPPGKVAFTRCPDYGPALTPVLAGLFDQLGGLRGLVNGKTVAVKINMTGSPRDRVGRTPAEYAQYTHPAVIGATVALLGRAGARRIRLLECAFACGDPLGEFMLDAGWDPQALINAAPNVELENTNLPGPWKKFRRLPTPGGGYMFQGFELSAAYEECDVMVSVAKLKEHATCGITLAMKNMFGITPVTIYGDHAGKDDPAPVARGGRGPLHSASRQPSTCAPAENNPGWSKNDKERVPRIVVDLCTARPLHLNIIDGIYSMAGGEGPWNGPRVRPVHPQLLIAGLNAVSTDAVGAALMGFDPMAEKGAAPFEHCDSTLALAEAKGLGVRDLRRIEVIGPKIEDARFDFRSAPMPRRG